METVLKRKIKVFLLLKKRKERQHQWVSKLLHNTEDLKRFYVFLTKRRNTSDEPLPWSQMQYGQNKMNGYLELHNTAVTSSAGNEYVVCTVVHSCA